MKGFSRKNLLFSLCGLNCGLCTMRLGGHCGGCGNGNQSCKIARCSLEHGGMEYCCECPQYPCEKYEKIGEYDSFITARRQKADMEKLRDIGAERYNAEQGRRCSCWSICFLPAMTGAGKRSFVWQSICWSFPMCKVSLISLWHLICQP